MKKYSLVSIIFFSLTFHQELFGQRIPADSPKSLLVQRVGLTDITINYSRPNVKGRKIFGGLIPYHEVWRTGADLPTFITFKDTTFVEGKQNRLLPRKYALYTIPGPDKWIIVFSKDTGLWGAYGYAEKDDALRVEVKSDSSNRFTETFQVDFTDLTANTANIVLQWEKTRVGFHISVDITQRILSYVKESEGKKGKPDWWIYWSGAKYLLANDLDVNLALEWINKSLEIRPSDVSMWTKAQILAAMKNYKGAIEMGEKAIETGTSKENAPYFPYESVYRMEIEKWKVALNAK